MRRSIRACRTVGDARKGPSTVRWVAFAIIAAHISRADNVLRNDTSNTHGWSSFGAAVAATPDVIVVGAQYEDGSGTGVNGAQGGFDSENSGAAYIFERAESGWTQTAYLKAPNADPGDRFGSSVAVDGDFVVVGALGEDSVATGVDGDQGDNDLANAGAAYVYQRIDNSWKQVAYLKAWEAREGNRFGEAAGISGDAFVVGAPLDGGGATHSGAAYVLRRLGGEAAGE